MLSYVLSCIAAIIILCMVFAYFRTKRTLIKTAKELTEVKNQIKDLANTEKMYERLGVDDIKIEFGQGLHCIANPEQDGKFLYQITILRQRLTDKLGYVLPQVRVCDSKELGENEFAIYIHDIKILTNCIYPNKYLTYIEDYENNSQNVPRDNISCTTPNHTEGCWITEADKELLSKNIKCTNPTDAMTDYLSVTAIEYVNDILSLKETGKYLDNIRKNYSSDVVDDVLAVIPISTVRQIFSDLIREKVSIKDTGFIFDKLSEYVRFSQESYILSERVRSALCHQIVSNHTVYNTLFSVTLSEGFEKLLDESCQFTEIGIMFFLNPAQVKIIIDAAKTTISETYKKISRKPVILCSPRIRLPLFQLLVRHIPDVTVISYAELTTDIKVDNEDIIGKNYNYDDLISVE